jgi:putative sterol carrier protein
LYTIIKAESGTAYSISVDYSPRAGAENNSVIDVFWGGVKVGTLDATTVGMKTYTFVVPVTADGDAKLEFKAPDSNSLGGVMDNISVTQVLNTGLEDHAIKLSAIDAYATDKDGSETLKLEISGVPEGATISDGAGHTFTASAGNQNIDISDWNKATLVFNPAAGGDLEAVVQFDVSGAEPGQYYLDIAAGQCRAYAGTHAAPTLTIHTPSDVWLQISNGDLDGAQAMMAGQYTVEGDLGLLIRFNQLFAVA